MERASALGLGAGMPPMLNRASYLGAATFVRLHLAQIDVGAVVVPDDAVAMAAEAADVHLDAAPGGEAAVLDAELAVDVDRPARVGLEEREERFAEARIVAGIVAAPGALAGATEEVAGVVAGDGIAAAAAGAGLCRRLVHGDRVGKWRRGG